MSIRSLLLLLGGTFLLSTVSETYASNNLYRYRDHNGTVVLGKTIPPEYVQKGYEVLNPSGRVIEIIPPAPTPEELIKREAEAAEAKRREDEIRKRIENDALLLRLYSHPDEAVLARDRKLQEIGGVIDMKRSNLQVLDNQIKEIQTQAAEIERSGRVVPEEMQERVLRLQKNVRDLQRDIEQVQQEKQNAEKEFAEKIDRLRYLQERRNANSSAQHKI
jgi:uncharacterized protein YoxC